MANNINTITNSSTIFLNKISELSNRIKILNQTPGVGQTQEALIIEANSLISSFFNQLSNPLFNPSDAIAGTKPDALNYNNNFSNLSFDLNVLFSELINIGNIVLTNFNFMISENNNLLAQLKQSYSKLQDYILYSTDPNKDSIYFTDSFNNLNRTDFNSKLISTEQAEVNQGAGSVTLPIDTAAEVPIVITIKPVINSNSNGNPGNNYELNASLNDDLTSILDNNPDTWFEYEKVILNTSDTFDSLVLDITLNLGDPRITNYIRVNPNNFGTQNSIEIETIETSFDGKTFTDIKSDIPDVGFEETSKFSLCPSTSQYAGQGIYLYTPRLTKYIHITFKQSTPYSIIDNTNTSRIRYAIGLRDIEIRAIPYKSTGELISTAYTNDDEIKKISVISNQFPTEESSLVNIKHFISVDDGLTWNEISPRNIETNSLVQAILNINTVDTDSINTNSPVYNMRYKALLSRDDNNINDPSSLSIIKPQHISELRTVPSSSPFSIKLNNIPIANTLKLTALGFGSRGLNDTRAFIGNGTGNAVSFYIPYIPIKYDFFKNTEEEFAKLELVDSQAIRIDGQLWRRGSLSSSSATDQVYELDYTTGLLTFGDNVHGKAVPNGSVIDINFFPERLYITSDNKHIGKLDYSSSNDKASFILTNYGTISEYNEFLPKGATNFKLQHSNIQEFSFSDTTVFASYVSFVNGTSELNIAGQYTVDTINGIVYSKTPTNSVNDTSINYKYLPTKILSADDWDFIDNSNYQNIIINDTGFLSNHISNEIIPSGVKYFTLRNLSIVKNSISFNGINNSLLTEVPYIDGRTELLNDIATVENIGLLSHGVNTYNFKMPISEAPDSKIIFSDTSLFANLVSSVIDVVAAGDYFINKIANTLTVFINDTSVDAGTITYYYNDFTKSSSGLYSVNYNTGEIYSSTSTDNGMSVNYQYTHYVAQYSITRNINSTDFTYNASTGTLTISEREIIKHNKLKTNDPLSAYYQIFYDIVDETTNNLNEVVKYFSPILSDYAIKLIRESEFLF
jgi:hypothetical protein